MGSFELIDGLGKEPTMEHRDGVSETKEYKKYRERVLASRPSLIKAREESVQSKAL
jgi:hypothetical protein